MADKACVTIPCQENLEFLANHYIYVELVLRVLVYIIRMYVKHHDAR